MKKAFGIVLLALFLLQIGGGYIYFIARLSSIRMEMHEQLKTLPDHELTLLTFSESEYENAKADDYEVKVKGKMYDIARVVKRNGRILVYALQDEAEDNLLSVVREILDRSANDKKPVPAHCIQLLTLDFILIENEFPENDSVAIAHISNYLGSQLNCIYRIESPPPQSFNFQSYSSVA
jgi:hypothetical protein